MDITEKISPEMDYNLSEAWRLTPLRSYSTIKKAVASGELVASRVEWGYSVKGSDLINFLEVRFAPRTNEEAKTS
jgi:hypothetical protein